MELLINIIKHLIFGSIWSISLVYTLGELESGKTDLILGVAIFLCGVMACAQLAIALFEAEEIICNKLG